MEQVLGLVLGGGRGAGLYPLTKHRSEPAVPVAGKYRLIDIPLSNCINSGVHHVHVLTQYLSVSLHRHIAATYKFDPFTRGSVEVLAAQQTNETADWYRGTADAVRQNILTVQEEGCRDVLVLSGDQLYRMDFRHLVETHRASEADVTVAVLPVPEVRAPSYGVVRINAERRIIALGEKPRTREQLAAVRTPAEELQQLGVVPRGREYLANMGIYLFRRSALLDLLASAPLAHDFVLELFPRHLQTHQIQAYLFDGYWEDVGTIRTYFEASLALASDAPPFDFHSAEGVIYTRMRNLPASRIRAAETRQSLISDGCFVEEGVRLERCSLGVRSRIGRNAVLRDVVLLGANYLETESEIAANARRGVPAVGVGEGAVLERVIVDKNCRIGRNVRIVNARGVQNDEGSNYVIRDGIVVIPNEAVVPDGTVI